MKNQKTLYIDFQAIRKFTGSTLICSLIAVFLGNSPLHAQWVQQGPGPSKSGQVENITDGEVVGAVNCVTPHPSNANILYIGTVNGGVWRTGDATTSSPTWTLISGNITSQAIGALEFDPTDASNQTLVLGIGMTSSFGGTGTGARGIFRTTTGIDPWMNIDAGGIFANRNVTGIAPRGATIVVASPNGGIYRTTDTGVIWAQVSGTAGTNLPAGNSFDLVGDPNDSTILYTNAGTNGIYKSTDTGATWNKVSDAALDGDLAVASNLEIAVGQNNNIFIAIVGGGRLRAVYRSGNGGANWTSLDIPQTTELGTVFGIHVGGQGNTHLSLAADPGNNNVCYIGGDRQVRLDETPAWAPGNPRWPNSSGANSFTGRLFRIDATLAIGNQVTPITHVGTASNSSPHADSRDMDFDANGNLIEGDDGGVYKQSSPSDATGDWSSSIGNINVSEIHSADWDAVSNIIIGGLQDNGVHQQDLPTNGSWTVRRRGDGGDVAVDDISVANSSTRYMSTQRLGSFRREVYDSANVFQSSTIAGVVDTATGNTIGNSPFVAPIKLNSQNGQRLIITSNAWTYESFDQGDTLNRVGIQTANSNGFDCIAYGASDNAEILYIGSGSNVFIRNAAAPDPLAASAAYVGGNVRGVTIDPNDSQSAFVIDSNNVFETDDEGASWNDITGNLLGFSPGNFTSIAYMPNSGDDMLAVGTDLGVYAAPGPGFNVWFPLGNNLPQVQVLDLEYDDADDILLAGTMGRGAWTFNFSERDPVDVALVLDLSGSMLSEACPGCDSRLTVLKDAVEIFMQLWKGLAVDDDRIGTVYFQTNVHAYAEEWANSIMLDVIDETDDMIDDIQDQNTNWNQLTAMGGGLQFAVNELSDDSRPRNIILFTDGMQNVDPGVVFPGLTIENGEFATDSGINPNVPPTDLDDSLDIKVNTIGVGATGAFETQLADIAAGTDGLTKITTAPDADLRQFYVEELVDILRDFSPQLVAYRKGTINQEADEHFTINESARKVIFKVSYKRLDQVITEIYKGKTKITKLADITYGPFYQIFSFPFARLNLLNGPQFRGGWSVKMNSNASVKYEVAAIADESNLKYSLSLGKGPFKAGQPLEISAEILVNGERITDNVTVEAVVKRPKQALGTLLSTTPMPQTSINLEPNLKPGMQKLILLSQNVGFFNKIQPIIVGNNNLSPGPDRVFKKSITNTNIPGAYTVVFTIKGSHPDIGSFERVEQMTAVVRFSGFDLDSLQMFTAKTKEGDNTLWTFTLTPKDRFGNYLGPDYADVLEASSNNGTIKEVKDFGDGTYEILILTSGNEEPNLKISLYDETLFDERKGGECMCSRLKELERNYSELKKIIAEQAMDIRKLKNAID